MTKKPKAEKWTRAKVLKAMRAIDSRYQQARLGEIAKLDKERKRAAKEVYRHCEHERDDVSGYCRDCWMKMW